MEKNECKNDFINDELAKFIAKITKGDYNPTEHVDRIDRVHDNYIMGCIGHDMMRMGRDPIAIFEKCRPDIIKNIIRKTNNDKENIGIVITEYNPEFEDAIRRYILGTEESNKNDKDKENETMSEANNPNFHEGNGDTTSQTRRIDLDNPNSQPFCAVNMMNTKPLNTKATLRMIAPILYPADVDANVQIRIPGKLTTDYLTLKSSIILNCLSDEILDREIKHIGTTKDESTNMMIFYVALL